MLHYARVWRASLERESLGARRSFNSPAVHTPPDETTMNGLFASRAPQGAESARWKCFRILFGLAIFLACHLAALPTRAQSCSPAARPQDELWFVDTRPASCAAQPGDELPKLTVHRRAPHNAWVRSRAADLLSANPNVQTVIWVHGNRVSASESRQRGWEFYRSLTSHADQRPLRLIIWSWPADQIRGQVQDVRYKAMLTVPAAYHLARFLAQLDPATPLGLVGFSYGSRVITGAMHLQAGGKLGQFRLASAAPTAGPTPRAVLWASAINDDWLLPGRYHGQALEQLQYATFLNNSCDRALKWYRFLDRCARPTALGYWGIAGVNRLGANRAKVEQLDVACLVGSTHSDSSYIYNAGVMRRTWSGIVSPASTIAAGGSPASVSPAAGSQPAANAQMAPSSRPSPSVAKVAVKK